MRPLGPHVALRGNVVARRQCIIAYGIKRLMVSIDLFSPEQDDPWNTVAEWIDDEEVTKVTWSVY